MPYLFLVFLLWLWTGNCLQDKIIFAQNHCFLKSDNLQLQQINLHAENYNFFQNISNKLGKTGSNTLKTKAYVMRCAIWHYLYNLKNVTNTHEGVLILLKLQAVTLLHGCFSRFLNCANGTKSRNTSYINPIMPGICMIFLWRICGTRQIQG